MKTRDACVFLHFLFNLTAMAGSDALEHVNYTHAQAQIFFIFFLTSLLWQGAMR